MAWIQPVDPLHNLKLSALVAIIPVLVIFWALIIKKTKGYKASLMACAAAIIIALTIYRMPVKLAFLSVANGALYGFFPICWIVISAVFLFNLTVKSGQFEIIKHSMAAITADRRLQAILIAFSFGAFLEGTAGFGAPVAITAAMLVGLEFDAMYATGLCLVANTVPVAFGSVGIPIAVASQVSGLPEMQISQMIGRTLPLLSLLTPLYLVVLMSGFKKAMEVLPAILVSGGSFAILQFVTANFVGPALPDIIAGIGSIIALVVFLKFWKPKTIWRFKNEKSPMAIVRDEYSVNRVITAWSPFLLLTIIILTWGLPPVKEFLNAKGQLQFAFPGLNNAIADPKGIPLSHIFKFNYLSAAGTAVFISALAAIPVVGLTFKEGLNVFGETMKQLKFPILKYVGVLATGYNIVDTAVCKQKGVIVTNVPGYGTGAVAQFVFALLLELCLHVQKHSDAVMDGKWSKSKDFCFWDYPLIELVGKTLGIIGFGTIGQKVADIATAFDMNVIATGRRQTDQSHRKNFKWVSLDDLLRQSDAVSIHCPLTPETQGLINAQNLKKMKPSAFLINTSRGPIVNDADLAYALNNGIIAGAGIDVLSKEPPLVDNPIFNAKNCIVTPHIAWAAKEARTRLMDTAINNLERFIAGTPVNVVNN